MDLSNLVYLYLFWFAPPASRVVTGPSALTYGFPACWPAGLARLPGGWRDAGRWCSLLIFGHRHAVHFDMPDREESPDKETDHGT